MFFLEMFLVFWFHRRSIAMCKLVVIDLLKGLKIAFPLIVFPVGDRNVCFARVDVISKNLTLAKHVGREKVRKISENRDAKIQRETPC
jgi:hypothetical protein